MTSTGELQGQSSMILNIGYNWCLSQKFQRLFSRQTAFSWF